MKIKFAKSSLGTKSLKIDKTQSTMLSIVAIATVVTVFCLTSARVLLSQAFYQQRVINARNASVKQLNANINAASTLNTQYSSVFLGSSGQNIIGGQSNSSSSALPPDGDNGKIVLDALPTTYDFPALLTSLSKILNADGVGAQSIDGTDQLTAVSSIPTYNPQPTPINLTISGTATYDGSSTLLSDLERSIRPFDVTHLTLTGNQSNLVMSLDLTTYYQPAKTLSIPSKEIK
jgi:hypothetical protein